MVLQEYLGALSLILMAGSFLPIYQGVWRRTLRPHVFTWLIWGVVLTVGYMVQTAGNAGAGAWVMLFNAINCLAVAWLGWRYGHKDITRGDWVALVLGLGAIPVWLVTGSPFWALLIALAIDGCGYYPTYRKSWMRPWDESALSYVLGSLAYIVGLSAVQDVNFLTVAYQIFIVVTNAGLITLLLMRRRRISL